MFRYHFSALFGCISLVSAQPPIHYWSSCIRAYVNSNQRYGSYVPFVGNNGKQIILLLRQTSKRHQRPRTQDNHSLALPALRRHRSRRDYVYTNPFNDFRNFKTSLDYLFILYTSSNFLHSGPFYNHLYSFNIDHRTSLPARFVPFYV